MWKIHIAVLIGRNLSLELASKEAFDVLEKNDQEYVPRFDCCGVVLPAMTSQVLPGRQASFL
jgi:hypothetical protein